MATMVYEAEALAEADRIKNMLGAVLRSMALERAKMDDRTRVTVDDIRESVSAASEFLLAWHRDQAAADS